MEKMIKSKWNKWICDKYGNIWMKIFEYISKYVTSTVVDVNGKKKMMENRKFGENGSISVIW